MLQKGQDQVRKQRTIRLSNKLKDLEDEIAEVSAAKNAEVVKEHIGSIESLDGQFSQLGWWKLKQKISPPGNDPPMAKRDVHGNIVTAP